MALAVASRDVAAAAAVVEGEWAESLSEEALAAANLVVDLDADEATCPACTSPMPGGSARCPSCGLRFA